MILIVPDFVHDAINSALDRELALFPEAEKDRENLYKQLLNHFNETGIIPDFTISKKEQP